MKRKNSLPISLWSAVLLLSVALTAAGQTANEGNIANVVGGGAVVRWDVAVANAGGTLTITFPDGRAIRKAFKAGVSPQFTLGDKGFENLSDGVYSYELQLAPVVSVALKQSLAKARGQDDDPESERAGRKRPVLQALVQSGSFAVVNGSMIIAGAVEPDAGPAKAPARTGNILSGNTIRPVRSHHFALPHPDFVIADDLIVQGSACVGLDCVDGENFGFDTIRVKENNTRIQYDDTSTSAGFATNNWQIRANSSASGGGNFLAFVDQGSTGNSETGTIVFEVDSGAPANSLRVSSSGKVGIRTATPVLDVHANSTDTPAIRLEQNNSGGFTAQTWDMAGNEANFFVRDVTSGSRLPFRIRPGAPTSSIDISATGNVGIGTASPTTATGGRVVHVDNTTGAAVLRLGDGATNGAQWEWQSTVIGSTGAMNLSNITAVTNPFTVLATGNVGINTVAPTATLSVNGTANKPGGGSWDIFSDERLKNIKGRFNTGLKAVMQLRPIRYEYKPDNALNLTSTGENIGFGAQQLQKIIPEAVSTNQNGYLMVNNDPIMWTMLNAIQEQQKQIEELKGEIRTLRRQAQRRRR